MAEVDATRACVVCGTLFQRKGKKLLCSEACRKARNFRPCAVRNCGWCTAEFTPTHADGYVYCCQEHARLAKLRRDGARPAEHMAALREKYHASHYDAIRARDNAYKAKRRAEGTIDRTHDRMRRQRIKLVSGSLSRADVAAIKSERSDCLYCGVLLSCGDKFMDHMDPLSKGGAHDRSNIVVCCAKCNLSKSAKLFADWLLIVPASRRKMVARVYEKKRGATFEQPSLFGASIAA